ncbi:hypothetical protein JR316_0003141 [Psilocybe cubensis]|nr:hypothetical protein JR316_0003141 [Psilocybe cubensis]KAH9483671.1 hypothetical protein JR316_0003141 [Psilocybe cubensis]
MIQPIPGAHADDQPVNFGPVLWDVLNKVASNVGGADYLIGLSLRDPNNANVPILAGAAVDGLGANLDGLLLGNEPDIYAAHGYRPNVKNYTTALYINEFKTAADRLTNTSAGDIYDKHEIVGPTICCAWNLDALLDDGFSSSFGSNLKYISLQHYPQNNCNPGVFNFQLPYYVQHANVVTLGAWQSSGISKIVSNPNGQPVILSEFNSAACGGIAGISDTFAVGSLWTIDYSLQLASVGYSAAYIHTRERGVTYNLFTPPEGPNGGPGAWTTNPPYYGLLVTAEALRSENGSIVVDLDISGSKSKTDVAVSGYAVYDAVSKTVQQLVFFNYANVSSSDGSSQSFSVPSGTFAKGQGGVQVKYLVGDSMAEKVNIGWGGQTLATAGDGNLVSSNATWAVPNANIDCSNGCTINVPAPGMAVVFAGVPAKDNNANSNPSSGDTGGNSSGSIRPKATGSQIRVSFSSSNALLVISFIVLAVAASPFDHLFLFTF